MMNRNLVTLLLITIIVIIAAMLAYQSSAPTTRQEKAFLFPDLAARINDINKIKIESNTNQVILQKMEDSWVIASADNYPAIFEKVRAAVVSLAQFKIIAEKTDNPELYAKLGVQGHDKKASPSLLVTLFDSANNKIESVIIGSRSSGKSGSNLPGWYVRLPDMPRSYHVEGHHEFSAHTIDWFDRDLVDIQAARIREIKIEHPGGNNIIIGKNDMNQTEFELLMPEVESKPAQKIALARISKMLEGLYAEGVRLANNMVFPDETVNTSITTFDGQIINLRSAVLDNKYYSSFSFSADTSMAVEQQAKNVNGPGMEGTPDPAESSAVLNEKFGNWVFEIPEYKFADITANVQDITLQAP